MAQGDFNTELEGGAPPAQLAAKPFEWEVAHYFIMGTALFSIAWGSFNAFLVSRHFNDSISNFLTTFYEIRSQK